MNRDIDRLIEKLKVRFGGLIVQQLTVSRPTDDDGVWWISLPNSEDDVQVASSTGDCPLFVCCGRFLSPAQYGVEVETVDRAVDLITGALCAQQSAPMVVRKTGQA